MNTLLFVFLCSCSTWFCSLLLYGVLIFLIVFFKGDRIHFIEIHEETWCPDFIRQFIQLNLQTGWTQPGMVGILAQRSPAQTVAKVIAKQFSDAKKPSEKDEKNLFILDLCSGSGGPTPVIHSYLNESNLKTKTILTDLFPPVEKWKELPLFSETPNLSFCTSPVDATNIPPKLWQKHKEGKTIRTLFGAFHHFTPSLAISILSDAILSNHSFVMCEIMVSRNHIFDFLRWPFVFVLGAPYFWFIRVCQILTAKGPPVKTFSLFSSYVWLFSSFAI